MNRANVMKLVLRNRYWVSAAMMFLVAIALIEMTS